MRSRLDRSQMCSEIITKLRFYIDVCKPKKIKYLLERECH